MRVALISDLHANEVALRAVLADIDRRTVDALVCLGDVATLGPRPEAVVGLLRERGCPCIMGNHDAFLLDEQLIRSYTEAPVVVEAVDWCRARLSAADLDFLRAFAPRIELALDGADTLLAFHGTPRSHTQDLLATTPPAELDAHLDGFTATVLAGGHTHIQMLRQHRGTLLVNPGSVGLAFRQFAFGREPELTGFAEYAIVSGERGAIAVELRRLPLDRGALRAECGDSDNPLRSYWLAQYA